MQGPSITKFIPTSGQIGDNVSIYGTNLENITKVQFGAIPAQIVSQADTQIDTKVPQGAITAKINVLSEAVSPMVFTVDTPPPVDKKPIITSLEPTHGKVGDQVVIVGFNLEHITQVKIGSVVAQLINQTTSQITTKVPSGAKSGYVEVFGNAMSPSNFTVGSTPPQNPPTITDFNPKKAAVGASITLTGANLTQVKAVKVGGLLSPSFTEESSTSLRFTMPGPGYITITTTGGSATSTQQLELDTPPPPSTWNHYYGNFHCHTSYSDGSGTPDSRFAYMKNLANTTDKADWGAITDHHDELTLAEFQDIVAMANKYNEDNAFVALGGIEMDASPGEECCVGIDTYKLNGIPSTPAYYDWLRTNYPLTSVSQFNHPKDNNWGSFPGATREREKSQCLFEIYNAGHGISESQWNTALNAGWRVMPAGNGDLKESQSL